MNLNFSEEELSFQEEVKDFLRKELKPELVTKSRKTSAVFTENGKQYSLKKDGLFHLGRKNMEAPIGLKPKNIFFHRNVQKLGHPI